MKTTQKNNQNTTGNGYFHDRYTKDNRSIKEIANFAVADICTENLSMKSKFSLISCGERGDGLALGNTGLRSGRKGLDTAEENPHFLSAFIDQTPVKYSCYSEK